MWLLVVLLLERRVLNRGGRRGNVGCIHQPLPDHIAEHGCAGEDQGSDLRGLALTVAKGDDADYSCLSNGNIQGGGVFWGDGSVADNALFITGGLSVWNSRTGNISAYLGAGYGINERLWRDISGKWAIVSDLSGRGMLFQAAAAFRFTHIALSPSLIYMPSTNYLLPSIGLGYSF